MINKNGSICDRKNELREEYKKIRNNINIKSKEQKTEEITKRFINTTQFKNAEIIAIYKSFSSEVSTEEIIKYALKSGKKIALPRVNKSKLDFYEIKSIDEKLIKSNFGIEEPIENSKTFVDKQKIDLVVVPGLAFDKEKNRLGYGGGFYDRFLAGINALKIGICFDEQLLKNETLPVKETDIKLDIIITDKEMVI